MDPYEFKEALQECEAAVLDLDKCLVDGRVAQGIGKQFLFREFKRGHLHHVYRGLANYKKVLQITEEQGEAAGLEYFANILFSTGCAYSPLIYAFAHRYIEKHRIPGAKEFVRQIKKIVPLTIISTIGFDIAAYVASNYFQTNGTNGYVANRIVWDADYWAKSLEMKIRDGKDKLDATMEKLHSRGSSGDNIFVLGNDELDHELMQASKLSVASPLADEETKRIADIWIPDYRLFLEELKV